MKIFLYIIRPPVEVVHPDNQAIKETIRELQDIFDLVDIEQTGTVVLEGLRIVLSQKGYSDHFINA